MDERRFETNNFFGIETNNSTDPNLMNEYEWKRTAEIQADGGGRFAEFVAGFNFV